MEKRIWTLLLNIIIFENRREIFFTYPYECWKAKGEMVSTSDSSLNGARSCTRVGPMGHESHAGPRSRTTHAPALTPDLTLSTECRFIIGHKLRRKNLEGNSIRCRALGFAFYWAIPTSCSVLESGRHARY